MHSTGACGVVVVWTHRAWPQRWGSRLVSPVSFHVQQRKALTCVEWMGAGILASQIGYSVTALQEDIIDKVGVACLDMEAAPIAQILNQAGVNMIALKVISNGVYPAEPKRMEAEYHDNREEVSRKATQALTQLLQYIDGKTPAQL